MTEKNFADQVLGPHLYSIGFIEVSARLIGSQRESRRRGGIRPWVETRRGIVGQLRRDASPNVTTMVDYYGLPAHGPGAWPGRADANRLPLHDKATRVEDAIQSDIARAMGHGFNPSRFLPYVMMHEFEAMLFSDCRKFAQAINHPDLAVPFQQVRDRFDTPEEINDSPETAPSRRITDLLPSYQKPLDGTTAASAIGLPAIRRECPHFAEWLAQLENLATHAV